MFNASQYSIVTVPDFPLQWHVHLFAVDIKPHFVEADEH